jgi:hypothetical protein
MLVRGSGDCFAGLQAAELYQQNHLPMYPPTVFSTRRQKDGATEKWFHRSGRYGYWLVPACRKYTGCLKLVRQTSRFRAALVHLSVASFFCPVLHLGNARAGDRRLLHGFAATEL